MKHQSSKALENQVQEKKGHFEIWKRTIYWRSVKIKMGNMITSSIASTILPTLMSVTGTVVKGVGTFHGGITPYIGKVAAFGLLTLLYKN